jgi:hypothetical protein
MCFVSETMYRIRQNLVYVGAHYTLMNIFSFYSNVFSTYNTLY